MSSVRKNRVFQGSDWTFHSGCRPKAQCRVLEDENEHANEDNGCAALPRSGTFTVSPDIRLSSRRSILGELSNENEYPGVGTQNLEARIQKRKPEIRRHDSSLETVD